MLSGASRPRVRTRERPVTFKREGRRQQNACRSLDQVGERRHETYADAVIELRPAASIPSLIYRDPISEKHDANLGAL